MHLLTRLKKLWECSDFLKNAALLMSGNIVAQSIAIGSSPILTRLFTPSNFGILSLLMTISAIIGSISTLCYERAIMLPEKDDRAFHVMLLSIIILASVCCLFAFLLFPVRNGIAGLLGNGELPMWLMIVPLAVFAQGLVRIFRYWHFRAKQFKRVAISRTCESITSAGIKIVAGLFIGTWSGGLIIGFLLSTLVALIILMENIKSLGIDNIRRSVSCRRIRSLMIEYRNFPLYATWSALMMRASKNAVVLILSAFFSVAVVGYFSLANRVLSQPVTLLSDSFSNVFLQKASQNVARNIDIAVPFMKVIGGLFLIGLIPFLTLGILGQEIFVFVFGDKWMTAGLYVQIMAPWLFMIFLSGPANVIYEVFQKQDVKLLINCCKSLLSIGTLIALSIIIRNPPIALIGFVGVNIFFDILSLAVSYKLVKRHPQAV